MNETVEMTPIDLSEHRCRCTPADDLQPIDDLFGPEPVPPSAEDRSAARPAPPKRSLSRDVPDAAWPGTRDADTAFAARRCRSVGAAKNVWDSPLMLIGGGTLGVILVVLSPAVLRSDARLGRRDVQQGRGGISRRIYANAMAIYEKFLQAISRRSERQPGPRPRAAWRRCGK